MTNMYSPRRERLLTFFRNIFRSLFVFFPGVIFLVLTIVAFWDLSQGEDLMVLATEQTWFFIFFEILLTFLVLVSWYSARIVANAKKNSPNTPPGYLDDKYYTHVPRFIGFSFFTIILLAFAQTPFFTQASVPKWVFYVLLALSLPYYRMLTRFFTRRFRVIKPNTLFWATIALIAVSTIILTVSVGRYTWPVLVLMVILLLVLQACFLILVITRRQVLDQEAIKGAPQPKPFNKWAKKSADFAQLPSAEVNFHFGFLIICLIALVIYLLSMFNIRYAVMLGSFPFVLLAFGVLLGVGFLLTSISIRIGLNVHFIIIFFVFLFGTWVERHRVDLLEREPAAERPFINRAGLKEYFLKWIEERNLLIDRSSEFPVYFVLSDGGASRSGYWVASVLGKLEDTTQRKFSKHLFCLSGASGGSVGNAAFFSLLKEAGDRPRPADDKTFYQAGREYLRSDFLTYTLSRMLGYDFFIQLWPFETSRDRAKALTEALEEAPPEGVLLKSKLALPLSSVAVYKDSIRTDLPIICINATRMQDGQPSVISTIDIDPAIFSNRVDVLDKLQPGKDMKLSTAVVLGASFPYVSPAGRIDETRVLRNGELVTRPNYFVDGGYVDNSGAGVVFEMINKLSSWRDSIATQPENSVLSDRVKKLSFYVLHISNGRSGELLLRKVNPFVNDLAAPLKTLVGSYNVQTSFNDSRLKNYLRTEYRNDDHYKSINLYRQMEPLTYSMNWVISGRTLDSMDVRLHSEEVNKYFGNIIKELNSP